MVKIGMMTYLTRYHKKSRETIVLFSQHCPRNHSQSAVENFGKLACMGTNKNIPEYSRQSTIPIKTRFCSDITSI